MLSLGGWPGSTSLVVHGETTSSSRGLLAPEGAERGATRGRGRSRSKERKGQSSLGLGAGLATDEDSSAKKGRCAPTRTPSERGRDSSGELSLSKGKKRRSRGKRKERKAKAGDNEGFRRGNFEQLFVTLDQMDATAAELLHYWDQWAWLPRLLR
jgi:hypothetical protein